MKKNLLILILFLGILIYTNPVVFAQKYDMSFKVRELTFGTGENLSNVKIDIDKGSYIGFTDANGVVRIQQIEAGRHEINISKEGYLEFNQGGNLAYPQFDYILGENKQFNASLPKKSQIGPWGTTILDSDWYKATYIDAQDCGAAGYDPLRWAQIIPIDNRIVAGRPGNEHAATSADSALVLQSIAALETNTGYDLINVVNGLAENSFSIYMESNTNVSSTWGENGMIFAGSSQIITKTQLKHVTHEIVHQFDMWPMELYPSVMDPVQSTMTDPQPYDYMHIWLTISEHLAKARGEQDLFLGNMFNYSVPVAPVKTSVTSPINNATGLNKLVRLTWKNIADADKYSVDISTNSGFANLVYDLNVQRIDTVITLAEGTKYYIRVRAENTVGESEWSDVVEFTTNHAPTKFTFTNPTNNQTIEYTNHNLEIETTIPTDQDNDPLIKKIHLVGNGLDTLILTDATVQTIYIDSKRLKLDIEYTLTGEVTDGKAVILASNIIKFKTPTGVGLVKLIPKYDLKVFPNPVSKDLNINMNIKGLSIVTITIYENSGRVIQQEVSEASGEYIAKLAMGTLNKGIYLLSVEVKIGDRNLEREMVKVVKL